MNFLERFVETKYWQVKLSLFCILIVLFFSFPSYEMFGSRNDNDTWSVVLRQINSPLLQQQSADSFSHNAKRAFRLFVPVTCKILHIKSIYAIYIIQVAAAFSFYLLVIGLTGKVIRNKIIAVLIALALCFTYIGQVGVVDVLAKFDGIAITCLLAAMYFRHPLLIFIFCSAAAWTDERGLVACAFIFLWWKIQESASGNFKLNHLFQIRSRSVATAVAILLYFSLRLYLQNQYGLTTAREGIGLSVLSGQFNMIFYGLWSGFEGFWIILLLAFLSLLLLKEYVLLALVCAITIVSVGISFLVLDITRSLIYSTPLIFIALFQLSKTESEAYLKKVLLLTLLICFIVPTYFAEGGFRIEGTNPLIFKLLDLVRSML